MVICCNDDFWRIFVYRAYQMMTGRKNKQFSFFMFNFFGMRGVHCTKNKKKNAWEYIFDICPKDWKFSSFFWHVSNMLHMGACVANFWDFVTFDIPTLALTNKLFKAHCFKLGGALPLAVIYHLEFSPQLIHQNITHFLYVRHNSTDICRLDQLQNHHLCKLLSKNPSHSFVDCCFSFSTIFQPPALIKLIFNA